MIMANREIVAFSLVFFLLFLSSFVANGNGLGGDAAVGGTKTIKDVKTNKEIQELGRFAVEDYNRLRHTQQPGGATGADLKFSKVVEAEQQVVSGIKYYMKIEAYGPSGGAPKTFNAEVIVKPWARVKELLRFAPSTAPAPSPKWYQMNGFRVE